jgi:tetratricopeptide (TPR) repeat protein
MQSAMAALAATNPDGPTLALRIGIETGEVLADTARARNEGDLFVTGDAVNTAARLEAAAEPGSVVVGPSTYAASRDIVEYRELPVLTLRGKAAPVAAWQAISVKARRADRRPPLGIGAPLVGRELELTLLKDAVRRAAEDRRPHLVTVIGAAGVGKSRLAWELEKYLDGLPSPHQWCKGRCLAYSSRSYGAIADIVKADARIQDDDAPAVARRKLRQRLTELPLEPVDETSVIAALEGVLAVGPGADQPLARAELFESWRRYLCAIAARHPLVLVIEDIHWADDGSLAFIDFLARWAEGPLVVLCLARHELLEMRPSWGGGLANALTVVVEPLAPDETARLLDALLTGGVPEPLRERIVALSEGNPLFVEEMVRMLLDRGVLRFSDGRWELAGDVAAVDIPPSVQAVLAARLDALPADEKRVAQDAAVVGRIFWDVVVAHLVRAERTSTHELIRRLRVRDLVVQRNPSSLADAREYGFRHVLVRDVAYESLPKRERARLHRDVAAWAETELADRIDEFAELIAGHLAAALAYEESFARAEDEDLCHLRELTRGAAERAARRAAAVSQMAAAAHWLRLAVDLARTLRVPPRDMARLAHEYADLAWENSDPRERSEVLAGAIEGLRGIADRTEEDERLLAALREQCGQALYDAGDVDAARAVLRVGIADLEPGPPTGGRAALLYRLGWTYWRAGEAEAAEPLLERAILEADSSRADEVLRWARHNLGIALSFQGRNDEAIALLEESFAAARAAGDRALLLRCYINVPATRYGRGDPLPPLVAVADEGLRLARRSAATHTLAWLAGNRSEFAREMGRLDEALAHADEAVRNADVISRSHQAARLLARALIHRLRGDPVAARRDVEEAERIGADHEPQIAVLLPRNRALEQWPDHPADAARSLADWAIEHRPLLGPRNPGVHELVRMAVRLDDDALLETAVELHRSTRAGEPSRLLAAREAWIDGLAADDLAAVEAAAAFLDEQGYRVSAADAWADAALLAARTGATSQADRRAREAYRSMGVHPLLGSLPETRWVAPGDGLRGASPEAAGAGHA